MKKPDLKKERILVVGSNSFIARHLISRLNKLKIKPYGISQNNNSNKGIVFFKVDLSDTEKLKDAIKKINPTIVVNLSGNTSHSLKDKGLVDNVNFIGTANLVESLSEIPLKKFIAAGSGEVYEGNPPFSENSNISFKNPYVSSKLKMESFLLGAYQLYGFPATILRLSVVYGPNQKGSQLIPSVISSLKKNQELLTTKGDQTRDFIYVEEVVDAIIQTMTIDGINGQIINIGSGMEIKIKNVLKEIAYLLNKGERLINHSLPYKQNETMRYCLSIKKAKKMLSWSPTRSFSEGLEETIKKWQ